MIIQIYMMIDGEQKAFLFGNSYKTWQLQFKEFCWSYKPSSILDVKTSQEKWIGWGGLKWCSADTFQKELDAEHYQGGVGKKARIHHKMIFNENRKAFNQAMDIWSQTVKREL